MHSAPHRVPLASRGGHARGRLMVPAVSRRLPRAVRGALASGRGLTVVMAVYMPAALWADAHLPFVAQRLVSVLTWLLLAGAFWAATSIERRQLVAVVLIATCFEIAFSIIWGLYRYRFGNLPLYVPPGHGLIYLLAVRLGGSALISAHRCRALWLVTATAASWTGIALFAGTRPDLVGASLLVYLVLFVWRSQRWSVYTGAFIVTSVLELLGTGFGNWRWAAAVPGLGVSQGNPPSAIAAGYCVLDTIVLFAVARWVARAPLAPVADSAAA
jgi:hypothetical protein